MATRLHTAHENPGGSSRDALQGGVSALENNAPIRVPFSAEIQPGSDRYPPFTTTCAPDSE